MTISRRLRNREGAALSTVTTMIFLVVFVVTLVFLTIIIAISQIKGTSGGTASITSEIKSEYSDERTLLYLTDEYGNKLTDIIGQAIVYPANQKIILPADLSGASVSSLAINNAEYACDVPSTNLFLATDYYDTKYQVSHVDLNRYLRCYVVPNKLGRMYGKDKYCIFAIYDEGGSGQENITLGNDTLSSVPACGGGSIVSADIAPPSGYSLPITIWLKKG